MEAAEMEATEMYCYFQKSKLAPGVLLKLLYSSALYLNASEMQAFQKVQSLALCSFSKGFPWELLLTIIRNVSHFWPYPTGRKYLNWLLQKYINKYKPCYGLILYIKLLTANTS